MADVLTKIYNESINAFNRGGVYRLGESNLNILFPFSVISLMQSRFLLLGNVILWLADFTFLLLGRVWKLITGAKCPNRRKENENA